MIILLCWSGRLSASEENEQDLCVGKLRSIPGLSTGQMAQRFAGEVRRLATRDSANETRLAFWLHAHWAIAKAYDSRNFEWLISEDGAYDSFSPSEFVHLERDQLEIYEKKAKSIVASFSEIRALPPTSSKEIRFKLKRLRDQSGRWTYLAVFLFPENFDFESFQHLPAIRRPWQGRSRYFVYEAIQPCVNHACDLSYKGIENSEKTGTISVEQLKAITWQNMPGGLVEFKDPSSGATRDPMDYFLRAAFGFFSNEREAHFIPERFIVENSK